MFEFSLMGMDIILYPVNHENIMFKQVACRIVLPIVHMTCVILNTFVKLLCVCACVCVYVLVNMQHILLIWHFWHFALYIFKIRRHKHTKYVHTVKICYWHNTLGPDTCACNSNCIIIIKRSACYI